MRLDNLMRYAWLLRTFRNGPELIAAYRAGRPAAEAVTWGGTRIVHPAGRVGLVGTLLEVWRERCYTGDFYAPADGDVVVDAGAHVGLFSILAARANPRCRVVALEPFSENHECLAANLGAAGATNVTPLRMALGKAGFGRMEAVGARSIDHMLEPGADPTSGDPVPIVPLDQLFDLAGAGRIAMLKCDVEGSEQDAFGDASPDSIRRIDRIAVEYHDNLRPGTLALLLERLGPTHDMDVRPEPGQFHGLLYAVRRRL
ncbi:MAG: FkbM family methyltransferase [Deltaproteobacteria bacterium]|nr:FkbM family methyltransferase [Deltaproteobacteria bacterium]